MFAALATADFWKMMAQGLWETFYMVTVSVLLAYLIGLPLGLILAVTDSEGLRPSPVLNKILGTIVNLLRSVPFLIMVFLLNGLTLLIVGTTVGSTAMIVGLVVAAFPFVARLVEGSAREVDRGILEASVSMGASTWQIITKVILPECKPSLINGATVATTTILGYSAMAGILGGGGLGSIAINYGYYRFNVVLEFFATALLVVLVQILQTVGTKLAIKCDKRIQK